MTTILNLAQFGVSVLLCLALLRTYQIVGVAAAMLTGTALRLALTIAFYPIVLRVPIPRLTPSLSDVRFIYHRLWSLS